MLDMQTSPRQGASRIGQAERDDTLLARNSRIAPGAGIIVRVRRQTDGDDRYDTFNVPYRKWMRVLDALNWIAENAAADLAYRWICGSKMCGTCAIRMNGREVLACWEAVEPEMTIEPLRNLPVIRDLVVDRTPFESKVALLEPWIERSDAYAGFPELLSHKQMKDASKALDCIGCMCCYSACPVIGLGDLTDFAGPAPLVQLGQTALDPRNSSAKVARSLALTGIFNCVSCYKCEEVCPAAIPIVSRIIEPLKAKAAPVPDEARHRSRFARNRVERGRVDPGALVLSVQGLRALAKLPRIIRLLLRGKINPLQTLFWTRTPAADPRAGCSVERSRNEICILSRLLGAQHLRRTQRRDPPRRARLGLELLQLESATCTGARELRAIDPGGFYALNVRILALAEREELPLMTICNTCTLNVLDAHAAFVSDKKLGLAVNEKLAEEGLQYSGRTRISHFLWVLYEDIGEARLRELITNPLSGSDGGGILRMPHHSSAVAIRLRRFAQ